MTEQTQDTMNLNDQTVNPVNEDNVDTLDLPGIPETKVKEWIDNYGFVFRIWFLGKQYVYRNFTYTEYKTLLKQIREDYAGRPPEEGDEGRGHKGRHSKDLDRRDRQSCGPGLKNHQSHEAIWAEIGSEKRKGAGQ